MDNIYKTNKRFNKSATNKNKFQFIPFLEYDKLK